MDVDDILDVTKISSQLGNFLLLEEAIILHNSLIILQNENHFDKIYFWGRINGINNNYYIAYGYRNDILTNRTYYYSINCINWVLLPKPIDDCRKLLINCKKLFNGDPKLKSSFQIYDFEDLTGSTGQIKEENRLSATIHQINDDVMIVPRGALFKRTDGVVVENQNFHGLNQLEAREIVNFLHFRVAQQKWNTNLLTRDDYNYALDFLDPCDIDLPERCWRLKVTENDGLVTLKSLYWHGLYFYHYLKTTKYGCVYFGNGIQSLDAPFLVSALEPDFIN